MFQGLRRWQDTLSVNGLAERTRASYRYYLLRFLSDVMKAPEDVTEEDVVSYLAQLPGNGHARSMFLRAVKSYYGWAVMRKICPENPVAHLRIPRPKYGPAPSLTKEQVRDLIEAGHAVEARRGYAFSLCYHTGARIGSLCALTPRDVANGFVHFRVVKGDWPYTVPLNEQARVAAAGLAAYGYDTLIGVGPARFRQWLTEAGRKIGVRVWPHLLRHSFATHLTEAGAPPDVLRELLGHRDYSQLARYVHTSDKRKRSAVNLL